MLSRLKQAWQNKRITVTTLIIVGVSCFVFGLGMSPGIHWIKPSAAETLPAAPRAVGGSGRVAKGGRGPFRTAGPQLPA